LLPFSKSLLNQTLAMQIFLLFPVITILSVILAWRTRGTDRGLSLAITVISIVFMVWYFSMLFALDFE